MEESKIPNFIRGSGSCGKENEGLDHVRALIYAHGVNCLVGMMNRPLQLSENGSRWAIETRFLEVRNEHGASRPLCKKKGPLFIVFHHHEARNMMEPIEGQLLDSRMSYYQTCLFWFWSPWTLVRHFYMGSGHCTFAPCGCGRGGKIMLKWKSWRNARLERVVCVEGDTGDVAFSLVYEEVSQMK